MANDDPILMANVSHSRWGEIPTSTLNSSSCVVSISDGEGFGFPKGGGGSCSLKRKRPPKIEIPNVSREISADISECSSAQGQGDGAVCFSDSGVAVFSVKGKKKFMEDAHRIVSSLSDKKGFFGVYDGHGGSKAAEFVAENLHLKIFEMLENSSDKNAKLEAMKAGYLRTDEEFLKQDFSSGACCVTALIEGEEMVISNLGDCRAVLCRGGIAEVLTTDHTPAREDERQRIEDKGGYVVFHRGSWRVHGMLAVSRSIGDAHLKNWVVAEPDTKVVALSPDMEYLVLASDGLWEEVGNQEAVDVVLQACSANKNVMKSPQEIVHCCVNDISISRSPRFSFIRSRRICHHASHEKMTTYLKLGEGDLCCENTSPQFKCPRVSTVKEMNAKTTSVPSNGGDEGWTENLVCGELVRACKDLANLAVSRGSLDDITVMIVDLRHHFKG
ncbi:probable protein phosphatase 2C 14 isoform X1 [Primulina eburnea]|uniref:probable protein phosphatase 2C 14 isoform X1 n=1 Tax=Primulina eburnea TaxID=1245227 RepID=UPI003C6C8A1F